MKPLWAINRGTKFAQTFLNVGEILLDIAPVNDIPISEWGTEVMQSKMITASYRNAYIILTTQRILLLWENGLGTCVTDSSELKLNAIKEILYGEEKTQKLFGIIPLNSAFEIRIVLKDNSYSSFTILKSCKYLSDKLIVDLKGMVVP